MRTVNISANRGHSPLLPNAYRALARFWIRRQDAGTIFIVDRGNNRIRKVTPDGVISTVAGSGEQRGVGDHGPASSARLQDPRGMALDAHGNLFVTDSGHNRICRITPGGSMTTVAGDGTAGFSGDGGPAGAGRVNYPGGWWWIREATSLLQTP